MIQKLNKFFLYYFLTKNSRFVFTSIENLYFGGNSSEFPNKATGTG